ncbi:TetR family transcriptional regulator [Pseudonocardia sediminis]|uniref:TetR family transcriptional regulator n=1 Tax=Pseudonocardia sediminis TaxID=1397368 RepID=A0A4Q7UX68_PSEST|nr:TetR family transcriptional regulator [Pseudonocardia sediminis]RZT85684.1 TetR family transcriptional regulator [Pseudonocardia sediminis]
MSRLEDHPTVRAVRAQRATVHSGDPAVGAHTKAGGEAAEPLDADRLRQLCLDLGADDVGFVEIERAEIADQRADVEAALPGARTLISLVRRMNVEAIRTPARSAGNVELHHTVDSLDDLGHDICRALQERGVRALNPAAAFPMETGNWPGKIWVVSHKPVAVAAGMGKMGIHRNVIHPRFGNFILLGTVIIEAEVDRYDRPIDFNPCLECKLCVASCPTGAISKTGEFNFSACITHNYREFMTGFGDWVGDVAAASGPEDYRGRVSDPETVSMWQSLSFGPQYKAGYCVSVCPAGEDVIGPFLDDRKAHMNTVVKPLQDKQEPVYVLAGGDAEEHVEKRFPHKTVRQAGLGMRPGTLDDFVLGLSLLFQRRPAAGLEADYHFTFTGAADRRLTVGIHDRAVTVSEGLHGRRRRRSRRRHRRMAQVRRAWPVEPGGERPGAGSGPAAPQDQPAWRPPPAAPLRRLLPVLSGRGTPEGWALNGRNLSAARGGPSSATSSAGRGGSMPRVSREQRALNHERVMEQASRLVRERGSGVSVAELMASVGLTPGGFYKHFASKGDLLAQASAAAFEERLASLSRLADTPDRAAARERFVSDYLSTGHRDHPAQGCAAVALATDAAHREADDPLHRSYVAGLRAMVEALVALGPAAHGEQPPGPGRSGAPDADGDPEATALADLATLVGAVVVARATVGDDVSERVLAAARDRLLQR